MSKETKQRIIDAIEPLPENKSILIFRASNGQVIIEHNHECKLNIPLSNDENIF